MWGLRPEGLRKGNTEDPLEVAYSLSSKLPTPALIQYIWQNVKYSKLPEANLTGRNVNATSESDVAKEDTQYTPTGTHCLTNP